MRRGITAAVMVLGTLLAVPAAAADVVVSAPRAGNDVATCLRDAGAGELTVFGPYSDARGAVAPIELLSSDDLRRVAEARLGDGPFCPEVARGGDVTLLVGLADTSDTTMLDIQGVVRDGADNPFGTPVTLGQISAYGGLEIAAAVGPSGDAVVAWSESSDPFAEGGAVQIKAVRRPPGGAWGRAEAVGSPTRYGRRESHTPPSVAAGVDAAGRTTVTSAQAVPGQTDDPARIDVATAPRTAGFGAVQRLTPRVQLLEAPALEVAPSGRALIAASDPEHGVITWERESGADGFGAASHMAREVGTVSGLDVALGDDGSAVVGFEYHGDRREGVGLLRRPAGAAFSPPDRVWSRGQRALFRATPAARAARADVSAAGGDAFSVAFLSFSYGGPLDRGRPSVALAADGRLALTAPTTRNRPGGDQLLAPVVAMGSLRGPLSVTRRGSPCRTTNGNAALLGADGAPRAAWTDNASTGLVEEGEMQRSAGRIHVVRPGETLATTTAAARTPRARIIAPKRRTRLFGGQPLKIKVRCDGPCDLRATAPRAGKPRAAGGASLRRAGTRTVTLPRVTDNPIAPSRPRSRLVRVEACSPDGTRVSSTQRRIVLVRRRPPPIPKPIRVRARRSGEDVIVTWRTRRPARRLTWTVMGATFDDFEDIESFDWRIPFAYVEGRGRRSFRVRLKSVRGYRIRGATINSYPHDPDARIRADSAEVRVPR